MGAPILVWGAGAIGGIFGAWLARAGHDVLLVDIDAAHVAAMNATGLAIEGPIEAFETPVRAMTPDAVRGTYDTVFLCVKGHLTKPAAEAMRPHLAPDGVVVSAQNGLCEAILGDVVGAERVVGSFVNFAGDYHGPGRILFGNRGKVAVGEMDGRITERAARIRDLMAVFEPEAELTDNIEGYLWGKLAYGTMLFATALTPLSMADNLARPDFAPVFVELAREVMKVATALGVKPLGFNGFSPDAYMASASPDAASQSLAALVRFTRATAKTHSGIWRDIKIRRRPTEVDMQVGAVVRAAEKLGVKTPLCQALLQLIKEVEAGREQNEALLTELRGVMAES